MRDLVSTYAEDERVLRLAQAWREDAELVLGAVHGGFRAILVAALRAQFAANEGPRVIVTGDPTALLEDLEELGCRAQVLPELDEHDDAGATDSDVPALARRVAALEGFLTGDLLLASPRAINQKVPDLERVAAVSLQLRVGDERDISELSEHLVDQGYRVAHSVEQPGQLAVRGGILDVFPWAGEHPLRIEFFGDEIDTIRRFDAFTQESVARVQEAVLATGGAVAADRPIWPQLPAGPILVLADVALRGRLKKDHGRREIRLARQLEHGAEDGASVTVERFAGDLRRDLAELRAVAAEPETRVLLLARNEEAATDLRGHAGDHQLPAEVAIGRLSHGFRDVETGLVAVHDFELAARQAMRRRKVTTVYGGTPLASITDLKHGDYVVHINHGIAKFRGMATLEKRGYLEDFLLLEFAEESRLYVPVTAIELVQKYVGGAGRHPPLSKIGGASWKRKKAKAEKSVEDLAADLLATHAKRAATTRPSHGADAAPQRAFEADFPYEETEDQLAASREIKRDLESEQCMDRLLCGDVGFGKTEIAMRAAFKVAAAGHQVAVLAPTTLLAEQHLRSFRERIEPHGLSVACVNRFRTTKERREILERAAHGDVDIVIGTHALLAKDVRFADLGLLIIDEEHRFGVKHKEQLKAVRAGNAAIDVLALSATPIPRTLHFSMLGMRDISVLAEPPASRLAVETRVAPWDRGLIRAALERELARQGQIFVVHNRVQDIDTIADRIGRLVPDMRIGVVHGQMDEGTIARTMQHFGAGGIDCLVATSIVESGIDIPNANTLFVNNAHAFGLAELHQLRGRIGRFTRQAYAYFLTPSAGGLQGEARHRLEAIQEYAELGAGFKLAMRDLELRGAGNLLGSEQSGHIDAIGYELYCRLLAEAVRRQGLASGANANELPHVPAESTSATLAFPVDAYIPDEYIESGALKFELHKGLEAARRVSDLRELHRAVRDRFGAIPEPTRRLFLSRAIRLRLADHAIGRVEVRERHLRLHLGGSLPDQLAAANVPEIVHVQPEGQVLVLFCRQDLSDQDLALDLLSRLLDLDLSFLAQPVAS